MAIRKVKQLPSGASGEYWKIISEQLDRISRKCTWSIALFKDQDASQSGNAHMGVIKAYSAILSPEQLLATNRTALGYEAIKAQASVMIQVPFNPNVGPWEELVPTDNDLANGEDI